MCDWDSPMVRKERKAGMGQAMQLRLLFGEAIC